MAKVSLYQQGRLASSLVGTPPVDDSMLRIAQAGLGSTVALASSIDLGGGRGYGRGGGAGLAGAQIGNAINRMMQAKNARQQMIDAGDFNNYKLEFGQSLDAQAAEARQQARISDNPVEYMKTFNQSMLDKRKELLQDPRFQGRNPALVHSVDSFLTSKINSLTGVNYEFADRVALSNSDMITLQNLENLSQLPYNNGYSDKALNERLGSLGDIYQNLLRSHLPDKAAGMVRDERQRVYHAFFDGMARNQSVNDARQMLYGGTFEDPHAYTNAIGSEGLAKLESAFRNAEDIKNQQFNLSNRASMVDLHNDLHDTAMSYRGDTSIESAQNAFDKLANMDRSLRSQLANANNDQERIAIGEKLSLVQREQTSALQERDSRSKEMRAQMEKQQKEQEQARKDAQSFDLVKINEMTATEPARAYNAAEAKVRGLMQSDNPEDKAALADAIRIRDGARTKYNTYRAEQERQKSALALQAFNGKDARAYRVNVDKRFDELNEMVKSKADPILMMNFARDLESEMRKADKAGALHPPGQRSVHYENMESAISSVYRAAAGRSQPNMLEQMFNKVTRKLPSDLDRFINSLPEGQREAARTSINNVYWSKFEYLKEKNPNASAADIDRIIKSRIYEKFSRGR